MKITFDQLALEVVRLAKESPDYVYPGDDSTGCTYTRVLADGGEKPPCLFGQALLNLGVPQEKIYGFDGPIKAMMDYLKIDYRPEQGFWASNVQQAQDDRAPWGPIVIEYGPPPLTGP